MVVLFTYRSLHIVDYVILPYMVMVYYCITENIITALKRWRICYFIYRTRELSEPVIEYFIVILLRVTYPYRYFVTRVTNVDAREVLVRLPWLSLYTHVSCMSYVSPHLAHRISLCLRTRNKVIIQLLDGYLLMSVLLLAIGLQLENVP